MKATETGKPILPPISILQLEDSLLDAELELSHLSRAGLAFEAHRVETCKEFTSALKSRRFDLILADFHLPGFNGLEALSIARELAPETPFIFVSGMLGEETAIESLKNGATDYVIKMRMERLVPSVKRAIAEVRERAERRRFEAALAETENRFRIMADSAPVMIWTAGPDKRWNYCNKLWLDFTKLTFEESSGTGWAPLVHPDDRARVLDAYAAAFDGPAGFTIEYRLLRHDGEYRWVVCQAVPRFDDGGEFAGFIGSCTDITEIKQTEERLRHSAKLESLGILAGGIAHDFNNLLTGIMGNASLVLEDLPPASRIVPLVENIIQAGETAAQLTRQMLAYSGKGRFVIEKVDLSKQVREIMPLLEASIPRMVEVKLELASDLPPINADPTQMQQLVMNLVINSAEAIGNGGGQVTVSTTVSDLDAVAGSTMLSGTAIPPGRHIALIVEDNGHGMDAATKSRIFDPFFTTKFTGRGLGLAAVSGIVRGHNAGIALSSEPGRGTEFRIYFPEATPEAENIPEVQPWNARIGNETILVVDDEAVVTRTARLALQKFGYTVLTAKNGREAVDLFRALASEIDLVLLDMTMPVMPGAEAFQQIRAIRPDVRVIASSGYDEAEAFSRFGDDIDGFIQKPYRAAQLAQKVEAALLKKAAASS